MIPLADKNGFGWDIPDEMEEKPPVTRTRAVYLMRCISDNVLPEIKGYWSEEKLLDALEYLSDVRFILDYEGSNSLEEAVKKSRLSSIGKKMIEEEIKKTAVSVEAGLEKGIPTAKVNVKNG